MHNIYSTANSGIIINIKRKPAVSNIGTATAKNNLYLPKAWQAGILTEHLAEFYAKFQKLIDSSFWGGYSF